MLDEDAVAQAFTCFWHSVSSSEFTVGVCAMKLLLSCIGMVLATTTAIAQPEWGQRRQEGSDRREDRTERGRDWGKDRDNRHDWRDRTTVREHYRGRVIRFGAPGYFVRTLPARTR